jgi:hypothetical protein
VLGAFLSPCDFSARPMRRIEHLDKNLVSKSVLSVARYEGIRCVKFQNSHAGGLVAAKTGPRGGVRSACEVKRQIMVSYPINSGDFFEFRLLPALRLGCTTASVLATR